MTSTNTSALLGTVQLTTYMESFPKQQLCVQHNVKASSAVTAIHLPILRVSVTVSGDECSQTRQ